jgi:type IV pilus assembly protein PilV
MKSSYHTVNNGETGFSLIEVLVAIVILSLGILGLAGLQAASIRNTSASGQRTIAINLAADIADRMRANPAGLADGDYIIDYDDVDIADLEHSACMTSAGCTSQELAENDTFQWNAALLTMLPQPADATIAGVICVDADIDSDEDLESTPLAPDCDDEVGTVPRAGYNGRLPYVVKIWWIEDRNIEDAPLKRLSVRFEP